MKSQKKKKKVDTTPKELGDLPTMPPVEDEEEVKEGQKSTKKHRKAEIIHTN